LRQIPVAAGQAGLILRALEPTMTTIPLGASSLSCSRLAYGCWRIAGSWNPAEVTPKSEAEGRRAVVAAFEAGYTLFDLADIYCDGVSEKIFGDVLKEVPWMRKQAVIATKCGIRKPGAPQPDSPYRYDFSADYIVASCEQSLRRLRVESIDVFQLHRPDWLMNPGEVADAFTVLRDTGKAREFGLSNFRPSQVAALQKACPMRLVVNQVEISLANLTAFEDGTLDQCLAEKMIPMAWSPLGGGQLADGARRVLPAQENYQTARVIAELDRVAKVRGASRTVVALAWLLRHPARIVPIVGSTDPARIAAAAKAADFEMSRDEWYRLLVAARGQPLP
jgi:predicted oxidoreductase